MKERHELIVIARISRIDARGNSRLRLNAYYYYRKYFRTIKRAPIPQLPCPSFLLFHLGPPESSSPCLRHLIFFFFHSFSSSSYPCVSIIPSTSSFAHLILPKSIDVNPGGWGSQPHRFLGSMAAPVRCSWQGMYRSLVASQRAVKISCYNFILTARAATRAEEFLLEHLPW